MGPFSVPSTDGYRYTLSIVDEYSDYVWLYFLKTKDGTEGKLKEWHALVQNQYGARLLEFHSDYGGEFTSNSLRKYWADNGIQFTSTPPSTPQHNGIAERKNRTLQESMRAMLSQARLPARFWALAMDAVVHIHNRSVRSVQRTRTPFEILNKVVPSLHTIRVFGCDAVVHRKDAAGKIVDRGRSMIFVGYDVGRGAYRFYDPNRSSVIVERDAEFDENKFTVSRSTAPSTSIVPSVFIV
jgi:hypothetical protein